VNLGALGCAFVATLLFLFTSSTAWLFASRIVSGLAISLAATAATAWVSEFTSDQKRASVYTTAGNFIGLALGALVSGLLASYLPAPLRLSYVVYLMPLWVTAIPVAVARETVRVQPGSLQASSLKPRIGVPQNLRCSAPAILCEGPLAL
jgi:MFS family permease